MKTIRIISNIAYNTDAFFSATVNRWVTRGVIDWCYWIRHKPDEDEKKEHIHFVLKPSARVDTVALRNDLNELDPNNSLPLTCTAKWSFTNSMDDWLLYAVHDRGYLASKGQRRNVRYDFDDLKSTDYDALRSDWAMIDRTKFDRLRHLSEAVEQRVPFALLVQSGLIPIAQRAQYEQQYVALIRLASARESGRKTPHEDLDCFIDSDGVLDERFVRDDSLYFPDID